MPYLKKAIVFLSKDPISQPVNTRLARVIGKEKATEIHNILVDHCINLAQRCRVPVFLSLKGDCGGEFAEYYKSQGIQVIPQAQGSLGDKIFDVFSLAERVVVLGTDCPNISISELQFALDRKDVTIGPSTDGGYWLIAASNPPKLLFENIPWSTTEVLQKTRIQLEYLNLPCQELLTLTDIDHYEDLLSFIQLPSPYPHLQEHLRSYARN